MNALANPAVGDYLQRHYVSAFQKVGTFKVDAWQKQGGNVAAYFCTDDGRVLHAMAGPVDADTFLREARWANEVWQMSKLEKLPDAKLPSFFRNAHRTRLKSAFGLDVPKNELPAANAVSQKLCDQLLKQNEQLQLPNQGQMHLLLAVAPMPRIEQIYRVVFARILNEQVSTDPVVVDVANP